MRDSLNRARCRLKAGLHTLIVAGAVGGGSIFGAEPREEKISPWDWSAALRGGGGYKDNILLSDFFKESSAFTFSEAEFFLFRAPVDGWEFTGLALGEDRRYWQSSEVEKEQLLLGSADLKKSFAERWKAVMNVQYFYNDQVFDASVAESLPFRVKTKLHRISGSPALQVDLPGQRRLELAFVLARNEFGRPLDDFWEAGPKLLFGQKYGISSEVTASAQWRQRIYDTRTAPGEDGTSLELNTPELELGVKHFWDREKEWKSRGRVGFELNQDNGSGFFDYRRWRVSKELSFTRGGFEGMLQAKFLHYEYLHQTVPDGRARRRTELIFGGRARKEIVKRISLFAEAEHEWVMATDLTERYRATTVWGGIEWEVK